MSGRSPAEAVSAFLDPIQRAVSCVTRTPLIVSPGGRRQLDRPHSLTFQQASPILLRTASGTRIGLELGMIYEIVPTDDEDRGPFKVSTRKYMYAVSNPDAAEVIAYHWHPTARGNRGHQPHAHLGSTQLDPESLLTKKMHIPTGRISIEEVLRFCVAELGAQPLRDDWSSVLADSEDLFKLWRTWHVEPKVSPG